MGSISMVVCQTCHRSNYQNLLLPSFFEFRDLLGSAITKFLSETLKTFDDKIMEATIASKTTLQVYEQQPNPTCKPIMHYLKITMKLTMMPPLILHLNIAI
jgi:hypothetical protein